MELTVQRPRTISGDVAARLERHITDDLAPGDKLPPERELCSTLGVSRATLREALRALEDRRLIERRPGRGTVVCAPPDPQLKLAFTPFAENDPDEFAQAAELRRLVEPRVAELAAQRATDLDLAQLDDILRQSHAGLTAEESLRLDVEFHRRLAVATGNPFLVGVCEAMNGLVHDVRLRSHWAREGRRNSIEGHQRLYAALAGRDPEAARQAMDAHLAEVGELIAGLDELLRSEPEL
ncbi:MAG: FadR/GntR family transcriptional regulator [Micropruina sp.]|uniref:FadR/GntR family transcriptional regulator n=1 Tax=Micropruina sp. TaxID=2737536 RepID=UPI0039E3F997